MSTLTIAGLLLIAVPLAFNAAIATLAARFDYPDILRQPAADVLAKFRAGGTLWSTWWAFALTAVFMVPLVVLLSRAIDDADPTLLAVATTVGVLAALVQFLGLVRWPCLIPYLARTDADPDASAAAATPSTSYFRPSTATSASPSASTSATCSLEPGPPSPLSLTQTAAAADWVAVPGIVIRPILMLCSLEFVGRHRLAGGSSPNDWPRSRTSPGRCGSSSPASRSSPRFNQSELARCSGAKTNPGPVAPGSRVGCGSRNPRPFWIPTHGDRSAAPRPLLTPR